MQAGQQSLLLVPDGSLQVVDVRVGDHVGAGRAGRHQAQGGGPRGQSQTGGRSRGRRREVVGDTDSVVVVVIVIIARKPRLATLAVFTLSVIAARSSHFVL